MKARIFVTLKKAVLDPQGKAIENSLQNLGFEGVTSVRQGKMIDLVINAANEIEAREKAKNMCEKLLVNTIVEDYDIEIKNK